MAKKSSKNSIENKRKGSTNAGEDTVRIDKWLWAARFFKTRGLATEAVSGGHAHLNGQRIKPSRAVKQGDRVLITKAGYEFDVEVLGISDKRGSAPIAQALYEEQEASRLKREAEAATQREDRMSRPDFGHRPDKKSRRERLKFTGKA